MAALAATLLCLTGVRAQEPIRFGRTPDISPDGRLVAFSYLGDIWTVETIGGIARPVTMHEAHDIDPVFSPDGRMIAFSSNRHGSYDVFVVPAVGGKPKRLTFDSADDVVNGWSPDGKTILFTSTRGTDFPHNTELYSVPVAGGRVQRVTCTEGRDGVFSPKGDQIAYVRGPGTWYRKGYRGSSNDDIWLCNTDGSNCRRVTDFTGQDASPMWSADGQSLYYVSECFGTPANIVRQTFNSAMKPIDKPLQITFHKDDGVRRGRVSGNGEWIVYECGTDLWVVSTKGGTPRKLAIEVHADDKVNSERTITYTSSASEFALSTDERQVAFVVHGEIFVVPIAGGKATRLTDHPANDHGISWSPDGKKILFASDRNGYEDLYIVESDDPEHSDLVKAHKFKVKQLTHTPEAEHAASFSPEMPGSPKLIAFIRGGKLWTMKHDGTNQKALVNDVTVIDYDWSPDAKYIVYARRDGYFASDLYIIPTDSSASAPAIAAAGTAVTAACPAGGAARNVTRFATYNTGVTWSLKGKKLAFISERRRDEKGVFVLSLQKPAVTGAPSNNDIDWEDIHLRVEQPAQLLAEEVAISADGSKVAIRALTSTSDGKENEDLWVARTDGSHLVRITTGNQRPHQIQWSRFMPDLIYYLDGRGTIHKAQATGASAMDFFRLSTTSTGADPNRISFSAKMTVRRDDLFHEMFEQSWRALSEEFYDPKYHGIDWSAVRVKYRPLVDHVAMREDFYSLVSLMLGELNASHLGIAGYRLPPEETTADLGLLFDPGYQGPGLKVAEIVKRGPADKRGLQLKPGDIISAVDGVELKQDTNLSKLLNAKVDETVELTLQTPATPSSPGAKPPATKKPKRVEIQAVNRDKMRELMYDRWVEHNARRVAELSHGKLGYIHVPSMDEAGLDRFIRALYSENFDKEALILDVRYNGGGYTHDQLLSFLGGREHTVFRQRDGGQGVVMRSFDRKWSKPVALLINNRSYSDAEIFPNAFRTLGLGKLVGQPTGAHVIGTYEVHLIDGSVFRIPRVGVYTSANVNMERQGVVPDVVVDQLPDQMAKGLDPQLDKAVEVVQQDVVAWKKARTTVALKPADSKTPAGVPTSSGK
ncbi:MAG: PDZ domain-containing protein [Planctomycetota bacterium]|nr:MAG: PDZ domain-containing protein [Planctomycetota bacterium]